MKRGGERRGDEDGKEEKKKMKKKRGGKEDEMKHLCFGLEWLLYEFTYLQFFSTLVPAFLVYCYLPGLKRDVNNQMLP